MRRTHFLPKLSLERPVTVAMVFIALLVVGLIAYVRIPISLLPSGEVNRFLGMWIPYPNASPVQTERQIARPVEDILRTMTGVRRVYTSSQVNGCWASIIFKDGVDMDEAYNQLRDRVDRLMVELPEDVRHIQIRQWDNDDIPIVGVDFLVNGEVEDMHAVVETQLRQPLAMVDGVANVEIVGPEESRVEINLSQELINTHQVDMFSLIQQLRRDNFSMSSGWISQNSQKLYVRSDSKFNSLDQVRNLPIENTPGLRLADIADVRYTPPESDHVYRVDGHPGISIVVHKQSLANTVEVTDAVIDLLENDLMKRPQLAAFQGHVFLNLADHIKATLRQLKLSGLWGGLFAMVVLFFFLRRVRITAVITAAIPLSIMISLTVFYFQGWTLNVGTMMGLIIGLGMVVDNSIVVVEAIYARRLAGESSHAASLRGATDVGLAITVSTLTTLVVFLPLIFMTGSENMSFWMSRIGMPVIYALIGSLVVALLFIPLATKHVMSDKRPVEPKILQRLNSVYQRALGWVMANRIESALLTFAVFATITIPNVPSSMNANGELIPRVFIRLEMPAHYTLAQTDSIMSVYEQFMLDNRERFGTTEVEVQFWRGRGSVWSNMAEDHREWYEVAWDNLLDALEIEHERPMTREEIFAYLRENAPRFAGVDINLDRRHHDFMQTSVTLFGEDTRTLVRLSDEVERRLRQVPHITQVHSDVVSSRDELQLLVNRERAQQFGIDANNLALTLNYVMRGMELNSVNAGDREIDVWMGLQKDDRRSLDQVMNLVVNGDNGARVPIRSLVNVSMGDALDRIERENGRTRVRVTAASSVQDLQQLAGDITAAVSSLEMPPGYQWSLSGRFEEIEEENTDMIFAVIMAILFVFLLMGILFESFVLPLSVLVSIPFSFLGVYWLLYIVGMQLNMLGNIGIIVLIGVVVNNAIVLVDLVNILRSQGYTRTEAIMEAGKHRFRPILMTSATTIFGLIPIAVGGANLIGLTYDCLGVAMIGGLVTSTLLTLFVVPLFYTFFDDMRITFGKVLGIAALNGQRKTTSQ